MHIPDGFLDYQTATAASVLACAGVALALRDVKRSLPPRRVPLVGLSAAFVFAAQMLNFPVAAGTSGHLIGAVLAAVLLGPGAAVIAMTAVLVLQCLMFADGGVTALGANVLNMAVIAPVVGYGIYAVVLRATGGGLRSQLLAAGFAAWCSTVVASVVCAAELACSGTVAWRLVLPAMGGVHMLIGIGEAAITMLVLSVVAASRPELLAASSRAPGNQRASLAYGFLAALGLVVFVAPVSSPLPDGLERVADRLDFARQATVAYAAPLPEYSGGGLVHASAVPSTVVAGCIGAVAAFGLAWLLAMMLTPKNGSRART